MFDVAFQFIPLFLPSSFIICWPGHFGFAAFAYADYGFIVKKLISFILFLAAFLTGVAVSSASADQITLRNGDVLNGKVETVTTDALVLQDDSLGTLTLPRVKVANIAFGTATATASAQGAVASGANTGIPNLATEANSVSDAAASALAAAYTAQANPQTNSNADANSSVETGLEAMAREIQGHSNLVQEVTAQVLGSSASPEAVGKINELLDGLSSGQIDMNGLRSQVQSAADQLQEYKKQMGSDAGEEVDAYLSILNAFLRETGTNSVP